MSNRWGLLAFLACVSAASGALATSGMPLSEIYATEVACELFRSGGLDAVTTTPPQAGQDVVIVTPHELAGTNWRCLPVSETYGYETPIRCTSGGVEFQSSVILNTSGAGTLSTSLAGVRRVLHRCSARSAFNEVFLFPSGGGMAVVYSEIIEPGDIDHLVAHLEFYRQYSDSNHGSPGGDVREAIRVGLEIAVGA